MDGHLAHFSKLLNFLHNTCQTTNTACEVLQKSCFDHRNVLTKWNLPADEEDDVYECTCQDHSTCVDEPVDLVNDIVSAVERAQATRKTVNTVGKINFNKSSKTNDTSRKLLSPKENQKGNLCSLSYGRRNEAQVRRSGSNENSAASVTRSLPSKGSITKLNKSSMFQTTYQKDFFQRKSRLSFHSSKYGMKTSRNLDMTQLASMRFSEVQTSLDVDNLLERVVIDVPVRSRDNAKTNYALQIGKDNECMIHSTVIRPVVHRYLPLKEAIDITGVPSELLKLLKIYHRYINHNANRQLKKTKRSCRDSFLEKLNESNKNSWHFVSVEPVVKLLLQYLHVYVEIISNKKEDMNTILIQNLEEEFDILSRHYHKILDKNTNFSDDALFTKRKVDSIQYEDVIEVWNWVLAGIWNRQCWSIFSDLKNSVKISYGNSSDCKILQNKFQEIQKLHIQIEILQILQNDVFPLISNLPDDHVALASLYKCCSALCNISTLTVPILLRI